MYLKYNSYHRSGRFTVIFQDFISSADRKTWFLLWWQTKFWCEVQLLYIFPRAKKNCPARHLLASKSCSFITFSTFSLQFFLIKADSFDKFKVWKCVHQNEKVFYVKIIFVLYKKFFSKTHITVFKDIYHICWTCWIFVNLLT